MSRNWNAVCTTQTASDWLARTRQPRILHIFDHACNLINERREVLSLVTPRIGNGPFNIVIQDELLFTECLDVESPVTVSANQLALGNLFIDTTEAKVWNPRPDWKTLHGKRDQISAQVEHLSYTNDQFSNSLALSLAIGDLRSALAATKQVAGLGQGLTPSGDDFITGALHALWIIHAPEIARAFAGEIASAAASLTTSLSAAWLRSAGRGEAGILWHGFFDTLVSENVDAVQRAMEKILDVGETSGADALAGFVSVCRTFKEHRIGECLS